MSFEGPRNGRETISETREKDMTKGSLLKDIFQWGTLAAVVAFAIPDAAFAQSVGASLTSFRAEDVARVPPLINAIAFTAGAALGISGALKLKAHAENPASEKLAPGIARLLAGGAVAALPILVNTAFQTLHFTSGAVGFTTIDPIPG